MQTTRNLILLICFVGLFVNLVFSMDKGKFLNCDQKDFCKRLRDTNAIKSQYLLNDFKIQDGSLHATLKNREDGTVFDPLTLVVDSYENGIFRLRMKEQVEYGVELKNRYDVKDVLVDSAKRIPITNDQFTSSVLKNGNSELIFENRDNEGFKIIFKVNGEETIVFNEKNLLVVENTLREKSENYSGESAVGMDFTFLKTKHVFGIPERAMRLALPPTKDKDNNVISEPYRLYNLDIFEYELNNPIGLYGVIPLLFGLNEQISSGVFVLNPSESFVDIIDNGNQYSAHWISETGVLDVFFLPGPTPKDVTKQISYLTGTMILPQKFALGYHQCRWNYKDEADVKDVNQKFDEYDIPYDVLWLDIEHTDGKKYFTWDSHVFPTPKDMQEELASRGRKMVTISDPHIKRESGYFVHDEATRNGYYVKNSEGTADYEGHCWPGSSSWLDFLNPTVRDYYASLYSFDRYEGSTKNLYTWIDMNEPSVFSGPEITMDKDALHYNNLRHREIHNLYGFYQGMATHQGHIQRRNGEDRPFILTRSLFAGSQRYVAKWTGDNAAEWSHLEIAQPMLLALSVSGMPFVGADVGGFFGNPESDLLVRWYQAGAFYPFFRGHAHIETKRREPWLFGDENTQLIRKAISKRYTLVPFYYTLAFESTLSGLPIVRPLFMEYPNDSNTFAIDDSFLVGSSLLVKPVSQKDAKSVDIYLPKENGGWFEYETGKKHNGGQTITLETSLEKGIPVFQRGGSIIPTQERLRRSTQQMSNDPFTLRIALDTNNRASGNLYIDDGSSFNYKKGQYVYRTFSFDTDVLRCADGDVESLIYNRNAVDDSFVQRSKSFTVNNQIERVVIYGLNKEPKSIVLKHKTPVESIQTGNAPVDVGLASPLQFTYNNGVLTIRKPFVSIIHDFNIHFTF
ncbi:hypothetical protein ABK040_005480 [Willaertia magna]